MSETSGREPSDCSRSSARQRKPVAVTRASSHARARRGTLLVAEAETFLKAPTEPRVHPLKLLARPVAGLTVAGLPRLALQQAAAASGVAR